MKKQITLGILGLALISGGLIARSWAIDWPQSAYREALTAFNPQETLLEPLPDLFWWSQDVNIDNPAFKRGRAWSPIVMDFGSQATVGVPGVPDPVVAVGRQNQLVFYRPNLGRGFNAGPQTPLAGTVTFGGTNGMRQETGVLTTNPVVADITIPGPPLRGGAPAGQPTTGTPQPGQPTTPGQPATPAPPGPASPAAAGGQRIIFVTHGLGVQQAGLATDDPAYVQGVMISAGADATNFTVTTLGKVKIQEPLTDRTGRETRITGMTFADIGDATNPLPLLFLTTADGQVIAVDTRTFLNTTASTAIDPAKAIRWRWINPGPRVVPPAGGGQPRFPNASLFQRIPFNDGMNPAVGRVALNGLPTLPTLPADVRRTNQDLQTQVRLLNREWLLFVADRNGNAWAIEAFGETRESATTAGQTNPTLTGKARTRWTARIPGGGQFPPRLGVPPLFWNGNTPSPSISGGSTGPDNGWDDLVVFAGVGSVTAFDAQGNFLKQDRPVFWDTSRFAPGVTPALGAGVTLSPLVRKLGEADGTTDRRWQFPETGQRAPADGRFIVTVVRAMAGWAGMRSFATNGQESTNTEADDDRIFIRWNEKYTRPVDRSRNTPVEPDSPQTYVERLGALAAYGSVETLQPIDTNQPVKITFSKLDTSVTPEVTTTYTIPAEYLSVVGQFTDTTRTDATQRSTRGRIAITKPVGVDNKGNAKELSQQDTVTVEYTPSSGGNRRAERDVPYPSRRGRDVEPNIPGVTRPQSGELVPVSIGVNAVTIQEEGQPNGEQDEFISRPQTDDNYDPPTGDVTQFALIPAMSVANDAIYFGSRYRGRLYVVDATSLLLRGQLINGAREQPATGTRPGPNDDIPAAIDPIGYPAIADGWMYAGYANGWLAAYANQGSGALGTDVTLPIGPINREGSRRSSIPMPQIRVTDSRGQPITDEDRLRFDWGQPLTLTVTFSQFVPDSLGLETNPVRVTIRGPMGDLPPVTVSPTEKRVQGGSLSGEAKIEVIIPNATPSNPMTPGTPLLKEVPDVTKRVGTPHWELRAEQIGTNWIRPGPPGTSETESIGPWEPDREAPSWNPDRNTAPWFTLNNPIALVYQPITGGRAQNIALLERFATAPAARFYESKNGDPYRTGQVGDVKAPDVITVGVDPANQHQLLFAEHGKSSPAMTLGIVDRSDLGLRPNLGSIRVRVQVSKVTKLGFPLLSADQQATGLPFGSVDQNYPDDGPDGFFPSIPGDRLNVVKEADATDAVQGAVALRGVVSDPANPLAPPVVGSDGFERKVLQPEPFKVSVNVPSYQPDGVYATRSRLTDPSTAGAGPPVPSPATSIDPRAPNRDYAPEDPTADVNNAPNNVGLNDRPARVTVFVDANNNGKLDLQGNYREAYRTFVVQVAVRPDMRLATSAVAPRSGSLSRLLDLGKMWHGFGTPTWRQLTAPGFSAEGRTFFEQYWKPFVLQNTGNVNLIRVKPEVMLSAEGKPLGPVSLPSDGVDPFESLTLMRDPLRGGNASDPLQIYLRTSFDDRLGLEQGKYNSGGVWLQKARPGSSSPGTGLYPENPAAAPNVPAYEPKLTLNIPMATPLGTYAGDVRFFNDRQVALVQDDGAPLGFRYDLQPGGNNGFLDRARDPQSGLFPPLEPFADPTITVKVRVTENVASGSTGDAALRSQAGVPAGAPLARTTPAAGLDFSTGRLLLFYSTNQEGLKLSPPQPLRYDVFGTGMSFDSKIGSFPFDSTPLSGTVWGSPVRLSDQAAPGAGVVVKNTKPAFAQDPRADVPANGRAGYVFWTEDQQAGPGRSQARILYRRVTPSVGNLQVLAPGGAAAEAGGVRQSPRAAAVPLPNGLRWFVFWNGSQQQKGNILFSQSSDPSDSGLWTAETVVPTSPSLGTVSDATPSYMPTTGTLWLFYSGFSQRLNRSDVFATKLDPTTIGSRQTVQDTAPGSTRRSTFGLLGFAPRLGEILRANPTRTVFTAGGVDWRVDRNNPLSIFINGYVPLPTGGGSRPGAQANGLQVYVNGSLVALTYRGLGANEEQNWTFESPLKGGSTATVYVTVDGTSGTVRLSQPPGRLAGTPQDPQVVADYIPGSLRLTTSDVGATGGVGFMTSTYEPSWYWNTLDNRLPLAQRQNKTGAPFGARADRLWAVFRRPGSGTTLGPTLYYKTLRPGLQLIRPLRGTPATNGNFYQFSIQAADDKGSAPVLQDVDVQDGVLYFRQEDENRKVSVTVRDINGSTVTQETHYVGWREEGPEVPVPMDISVNEGTLSAFPMSDTRPFVNVSQPGAPAELPHLTKIWLFWTSTRGTGSDIFHATINPRLTALPG